MSGSDDLKRYLRRARDVFASRRSGDARFPIYLEYPVDPKPRYGYGKPPHPKLNEIIARNREAYADHLKSFLAFEADYARIPLDATAPEEPCWQNAWMAGLDAVALYGFVARTDPAQYVEVGSGFSTKFVRRAIRDHGLRTRITSIDPKPRAVIDSLCDRVIRTPLEDADLAVFDTLNSDDIVFIDGSHRSFMNSDATVAFLDLMPRLRGGVLVEFHDICLPWDYPQSFGDMYYSEQYLLASHLLADGSSTEIVLPNFFISVHPELHHILDPVWDRFTWSATPANGLSFWLRKR